MFALSSFSKIGLTVAWLYVLIMSRTCFTVNAHCIVSCLNVKELPARSRREIWSLSDCIWTRTLNHLVHKRTLNHSVWLSVRLWTKWLWVPVQLHSFTVAVLACLEYLFRDISLLVILAKWKSITLADILKNFAEIPSGLLALFTFSDLIILLMSLVPAYGRSNLLSGTHKSFIFWMLAWLL